jgi:hypothetical protein
MPWSSAYRWRRRLRYGSRTAGRYAHFPPANDVVAPQVRTLEQAIRKVKLEPIPAIISMKNLAPPAMAEITAHQVGLPPGVSAAGTVAVTFLASVRSARQKAHELRTRSPVGYLLGLHRELAPSMVARTARAVFHRAARP